MSLSWPGSGFSSFLWHQFKMGVIDLFEPSKMECAEFLHVEQVVDSGTLLLMTTLTTIPSRSSWTLHGTLAHRASALPTLASNSTQALNRSGTSLNVEEDIQDYSVWAEDVASLGKSWRECVDPSVLPFFAPVSVKWRRRTRMNHSSYDPWTWYNCLFMTLSKELGDSGLEVNPSTLRFTVKHLWESGSTVLGSGVTDWSQCYGTTPQEFLGQTTRRRWGSAPDAMLLCKAMNINLLIIDNARVLVRQTASRSSEKPWIVLRLMNNHYTVANRATIKPVAYRGRDVYTILDGHGREVHITHFDQFARVFSKKNVMQGAGFRSLAPFLSGWCFPCPGRAKPEKRPFLPGEKKNIQEPYWPAGDRNRKDSFSYLASWREEDCCSLVMGYLWSTSLSGLWCGIAIDNTLVLEFVEFGGGRFIDLFWSSSLSSSCSSSSSWHFQVLLLGGMLQQVPQRAIHFDDPSDTQSFGM
eukprot:6477942-Amphidinium_carterae.1